MALEMLSSEKASKRPWGVETLGHTLRVIDAEGNDIATFGNCQDPENRANAALIVRAVNGLETAHD